MFIYIKNPWPAPTILINIGMDSIVLVLEARKAVLAAFAFSSAVASTIPRTFFWFGQIKTQTSSTHFISIHYLPLFLLSLIHRIVDMKKTLVLFAIIYGSIINTLIVMDANFFTTNRFHMSLMTAILFDSSTYIFLLLQLMIMIVFHYFLGNEIGKSLKKRKGKTFVGISLTAVVIIMKQPRADWINCMK